MGAVDQDESLLATLVEHMTESIAIYDRDARVLYINATTARLFGRPAAEMTGKVLWTLFPDAVGNPFHTAFVRVAAGGEPETFDHYYAPWDRWLANRIERHGERIHVIARDITEQRRTESQMEVMGRVATERMNRLLGVATRLAIAENVDDVARIVVDTAGDVLDASVAGFWQLSGSDLVLLRSRGLGDSAERVRRIPLSTSAPVVDCATTGESVWISSRAEYAARYPSSEPKYRSEKAPPISFGCVPVMIERSVVGVLTIGFHEDRQLTPDERAFLEILGSHAGDALRRSRLYGELREASETSEAIVNASPAAIQLIDGDGIVRTWNAAAERIFGWTAEETIGRFHPSVDEAHREFFLANLAHVLAGNVITGQETRRRRANGEEFDVQLHAAPVRRSTGHVQCLAMVVDISERKRIERSNAMLLKETEEAWREADKASRAKDQFLAMLGHELRNPLAPISTAIELMKIRAPEVSRERAVIERQVAHLTRLVDDLLDVSRITRGMVELERERITLASVVTRAVELVRPALDKKEHRLTVGVPDELVVDGDPTRLAQVVSNLLTNAARYSDTGASTAVTAAREGNEIVLRVTDTGMGIDPEILPRIFDLFVQAPQTMARTTGGLGLGLAIVKNLVELHDGTVSARSGGLGHGTEVEVRLPLAPAVDASQAPAARAVNARSAKRRRVLVVDDNHDAATLLAELLDGCGHDIRTAFDGSSAIEIAKDFRPEIAVLDLGLPLMDGYELARQLRSDPRHRGLRLIALSGYSQASDHQRSREAGFVQHLAKPVEIEALLRLVDAL